MTEGVYLSVCAYDPAGGHGCHLFWGKQKIRQLSPGDAAAYAAELTWIVAAAEYDAAMLAQLTELEVPRRLTGQLIRQVRADRRPILESATSPLRFQPIVSSLTGKGRIVCTLGEQEWTWDLATARQHLLHVMEVTAQVDLDLAYGTHLTGIVGLEAERARKVVVMLRHFMESTTDTSEPPTAP